ncbi:type II secretion system protein [Providencia hangzhouensis]|uniref:type II secretion system protein n=1 Tax=Providencia hangzhouensis TaxID=3031799 RepID=UPI0034DDA28B
MTNLARQIFFGNLCLAYKKWSHNKMKVELDTTQRGFTLIEIMIVLFIYLFFCYFFWFISMATASRKAAVNRCG